MSISYPTHVELVEVGPRDGFQSIKEFIPTELKKEIIDRLVDAGCTTVQVGLRQQRRIYSRHCMHFLMKN